VIKKKLRKQLQGKVEFNPFNDKFNYEELTSKLDALSEDDVLIVNSTPVFNFYYKEMYKKLGDFVTRYNSSSEILMKYFIGLANNDYYALKKASMERVKDEPHLEDLSSMSVPSPSEHIGNINVIAAFETIVDIINVILNYFRFFEDKKVNSNIQESEIARDIWRIYVFSNIYYNIKNAYDTVLWEDGYIEDMQGSLYLRFLDENYAINKMVGNFRQQKNILGYLMTIEKMLGHGSNLLSKTEIAAYRKSLMAKRKPVAIKEITVNHKGILSYELSTDKSTVKINEYMKKGQASIAAYYPYLQATKLPRLNNLTIDDLLVLFAQLNELVNRIEHLELDLEQSSLKQLAFRMRESDLIKYFLKTTFYSEKDIKAFLTLVGADGKSKTRLNLWKTPLIKYRDLFYFCLPANTSPNFLYLIDEWLEIGGYGIELEKRGGLFEEFVKSSANDRLIKKGIPFTIPKTDKFYNAENEYEEIDLIIAFEELLIVAELKNIKYPMEPRDYHNSLKRLREGAEQAKRKANFIVRNQECFVEELGDISKKRILPFVLTNFSIFSGLKLNDVPVIDFVLLESYIGSGEYTKIKVELIENEINTTNQEVVKYYNGNIEFIEKFPEYVNSPLPIQDFKDKAYVEDRVLTLEKASPQIYLEIADFFKK